MIVVRQQAEVQILCRFGDLKQPVVLGDPFPTGRGRPT